jgi:hypothetical protein
MRLIRTGIKSANPEQTSRQRYESETGRTSLNISVEGVASFRGRHIRHAGYFLNTLDHEDTRE